MVVQVTLPESSVLQHKEKQERCFNTAHHRHCPVLFQATELITIAIQVWENSVCLSVRVCIHIYSCTTLYTGLKQGVLFLPYTPVDSETLAYADLSQFLKASVFHNPLFVLNLIKSCRGKRVF